MDYTVNDLIGAIEAGHARETEDVFNSLVQSRQMAALEARKQEVAANLFSSVEESSDSDQGNE